MAASAPPEPARAPIFPPGMAMFPHLAVPISTEPMEARLVAELPTGDEWQFEPKWDGFRCLAFRDRGEVALMSKSGKPLGRYFPEIVAAVLQLSESRLVLDGELVLPRGESLSFADLQLRLHPSASRVARLSRETPARLMLFDCLQCGDAVLVDAPLDRRRAMLEELAARGMPELLRLSPATSEAATAQDWLARSHGALDGIVAKLRAGTYRPGERAMAKYKVRRTADCVIGGYRTDKSGTALASLLLGLYDKEERRHHVGFVAGLDAAQRAAMLERLRPLAAPSAFDGSAPGGKSRWSGERSTEWCAVRPELVIEVGYDQVTGRRLRHGASFLRWRPDKSPRQCRLDQLQAELRPAAIGELINPAPGE